jgi:hypothetical protein
MTAKDEASMANNQKDEAGEPVQCDPTHEADQRVPTPRHPLFGALKGYVQVMPGSDLTEPADPTWGDGNL